MNNVVLIGRLARDPEMTYSGETAITKFTLAVDRPRRQGEEQKADFIRITVFGKQAESSSKYLAKGRQAGVQGRIQTGSYKNKDGNTVYTTDVIADRIEFLGGSGGGASEDTPHGEAPRKSEAKREAGLNNAVKELDAFDDLPDSFQQAEDDIPF